MRATAKCRQPQPAILANGKKGGCYTFMSAVPVAGGNAPAWARNPYVFVYDHAGQARSQQGDHDAMGQIVV